MHSLSLEDMELEVFGRQTAYSFEGYVDYVDVMISEESWRSDLNTAESAVYYLSARIDNIEHIALEDENIFKKMLNFIKNIFNKIVEGVKNFFGWIINFFKNLFGKGGSGTCKSSKEEIAKVENEVVAKISENGDQEILDPEAIIEANKSSEKLVADVMPSVDKLEKLQDKLIVHLQNSTDTEGVKAVLEECANLQKVITDEVKTNKEYIASKKVKIAKSGKKLFGFAFKTNTKDLANGVVANSDKTVKKLGNGLGKLGNTLKKAESSVSKDSGDSKTKGGIIKAMHGNIAAISLFFATFTGSIKDISTSTAKVIQVQNLIDDTVEKSSGGSSDSGSKMLKFGDTLVPEFVKVRHLTKLEKQAVDESPNKERIYKEIEELISENPNANMGDIKFKDIYDDLWDALVEKYGKYDDSYRRKTGF